MTQPVDLEDVYTAVQFLDEQGVRIYESMQALEEGFREAKSRSFQDKNAKSKWG
jgi:hypothetical protein